MEFRLSPQAPFDFNLTLKYYTRSRFEIVDYVKNGVYFRLIACGESNYPVKVQSVGTVAKPELLVTILSKKVDKAVQKMIAEYIKRLFRTDYNLVGFYESVSKDSVLSGLIKRFYGLKNPQTIDLFETLVWVIIGQQVNLNFAYMLKKSLVEIFGAEYEIEGNKLYLLPTPDKLAAADKRLFREMKFSRNKTDYIIGLAQSLSSGQLNFNGLEDLSDDAVRAKLMNIHGVGRWTCEYCMLRSLGREDVCLSGDAGLRNALVRFYGFNKSVTEREIDKFMTRYRPYRGLATFYLWYGLSLSEDEYE